MSGKADERSVYGEPLNPMETAIARRVHELYSELRRRTGQEPMPDAIRTALKVAQMWAAAVQMTGGIDAEVERERGNEPLQ